MKIVQTSNYVQLLWRFVYIVKWTEPD